MAGWHPTQERAKQAARAWLTALSETSRQEAYREVRQAQGHVKAHVLTEDQGFQETFFLALGLGLGLVAILLLVLMISTPHFFSRAQRLLKSWFLTRRGTQHDSEDVGLSKTKRDNDRHPTTAAQAKLAALV